MLWLKQHKGTVVIRRADTPNTVVQLQKNQFGFIKLTFEHLYGHLHDRLGAAEPVGGALHHFPKGSRAQDATF